MLYREPWRFPPMTDKNEELSSFSPDDITQSNFGDYVLSVNVTDGDIVLDNHTSGLITLDKLAVVGATATASVGVVSNDIVVTNNDESTVNYDMGPSVKTISLNYTGTGLFTELSGDDNLNFTDLVVEEPLRYDNGTITYHHEPLSIDNYACVEYRLPTDTTYNSNAGHNVVRLNRLARDNDFIEMKRHSFTLQPGKYFVILRGLVYRTGSVFLYLSDGSNTILRSADGYQGTTYNKVFDLAAEGFIELTETKTITAYLRAYSTVNNVAYDFGVGAYPTEDNPENLFYQIEIWRTSDV